MKGAFCTPICARKQTNGPPVIDQGFSTGNCNRHHVLPGRVVGLFVQESRQMAHQSFTKAFLQTAATAIMCCQAERWTHPPPPVPPPPVPPPPLPPPPVPSPPVPPILLTQNLFLKRIVPTDNMRPKFDDAKRCHRLVKG